MGLMTYNNDWKAIQERFLPSKSMHQVRRNYTCLMLLTLVSCLVRLFFMVACSHYGIKLGLLNQCCVVSSYTSMSVFLNPWKRNVL